MLLVCWCGRKGVLLAVASLTLGPAEDGEKSLIFESAAGRREGIRERWSGDVDVGEMLDTEAEAGRPIAAALAPGRWREMLEALWEGGPWKSAGGGRRAVGGDLVDSGLGFDLDFPDGDTGDVGETFRSIGLSADRRDGECGVRAMLRRDWLSCKVEPGQM